MRQAAGAGAQQTLGTARPPTECPEGSGQILTLVGQSITWLLVFAGWIVVHLMTARRTRRQEELAMVGAIEKRVVALRDAAVAYYTAQPSDGDKAAEAHLKLELKSIVRSIGLLERRHPTKYNVESEIILLRRVLTGKNFESGVRTVTQPDADTVQEIWGRSDDLIAALEEAFEHVHKLA